MKALVVGASGQVGRALLGSVPLGVHAIGLSHSEIDITDERAVRHCVQDLMPELIINSAAYTAVDRAESEPDVAYAVNTLGPKALALGARSIGARLIHISTDFVFDGRSSVPYVPGAPTNPLSVYGATKRDGEAAVLEVLPDRSVVLRTAWVYAAEGKNFLLTMLRLMGEKKIVRVVADQVGTPTSARSIATALWKIAERAELSGMHHWTDAGVASWYDFAAVIAEEGFRAGLLPEDVAVVPIATEDYPTPARRPSYSVLDKGSLMRALGISPTDWRVALRRVLGELARG